MKYPRVVFTNHSAIIEQEEVILRNEIQISILFALI